MPVKKQKSRVVETSTSHFGIQKHWASYFILILACLVVCGASVLFEFIGLDDPTHIYENPHFNRPGLIPIFTFWTKDYFSLYIPVTYSVWAFIAKIAGSFSFPGSVNHLSPQVFHFFNLVFHTLNSCLVFHIVKKLLQTKKPEGSVWPALAGALLFASHPVQIETVAWISEFKGLLSTSFSLVCIQLFLFHPKAKKWSFLVFLLAMLSKPSALVTPLFLVCIEVLVLGKKWKRALLPAFHWLILISPLVVFTKSLQPDLNMNFIPPLWVRPLIAADSFAFYIFKLLFPWTLALDYGRSPQWVLENKFHFWTWIGPMMGGILITFLIKKYQNLAAGLLIFTLGILPISGLVPFEFQEHSSVSDHYLYLPLFGLSIFYAFLLVEFRLPKWPFVFVLVLLGMKSISQVFYWKDNETLFRHNLEVNPRSDLAYFTLAKPRFEQHLYEECIQLIQTSLTYNPNDVQAHMVIGASMIQMNRKQEAIDYYRSILRKPLNTSGKRVPIVAAIHSNLGTALHQTGQTSQAIEQFNKALEIDPDHINAHLNLGSIQEARGDYDAAIQHLQKAHSLSPENANIQARLDQALALKHR